MTDLFFGPIQKALSILIESGLIQFGLVQIGRSIFFLVHWFHSDRTSLPKILFCFDRMVKVQWNTFKRRKRWSLHCPKPSKGIVRSAWVSKSSSVQSPKIIKNFHFYFYIIFILIGESWKTHPHIESVSYPKLVQSSIGRVLQVLQLRFFWGQFDDEFELWISCNWVSVPAIDRNIQYLSILHLCEITCTFCSHSPVP